VLFFKSDSHVLDSSSKRVCGISRIGNVFQANFSSAQSSLRCLISQSSSELWKWHRRLGQLSFDLLCRLSGLGLLRGLPLLKFESDLVCPPCVTPRFRENKTKASIRVPRMFKSHVY
jgi:hypothetical protein